MNNHFLKNTAIITGALFAVAGCSSDNSAFESGSASDTANEIPAANDVITQTPDLDSFSVATEKLAVEALEHEGNTSEISIYVADRNNNPVPDNTAISFETSWGQVEPQCLTAKGACSVTWTESGQNTFLPANHSAIIIAYTRGEESFTDLNDNDLYDAGEPFTDISEPFLDINNNDTRDAATEEFIDGDADNTFDAADGLFTGTPCTGDNTVCNRVSTLIWDITRVTLSSSNASVSIESGSLPTTIDTTTNLTIKVTDIYGYNMADGTTVEVLSSDGKVEPAAINLAGNQTLFNLTYTTGSTASTTEVLTIKVKSAPSGLESIFTVSTTIP
ncbi:MAG: hypothetical protein IMF14_07605 [Proteobacteria bacterium]|nr:hypothetical protein [Pseudomonadota bacterium]